jgi:hypothetical protein
MKNEKEVIVPKEPKPELYQYAKTSQALDQHFKGSMRGSSVE